MRKAPARLMFKLAAHKCGPFSKALEGFKVDVSDEFGVVFEPKSIEKTKATLGKAGFEVKFTKAKHITRCHVTDKDGDLRAMGASGDETDAFMQAMLGAVREEHATVKVTEALSVKGVEVDDALRGQLERRYILAAENADAQLAEDLKAFDKAV